MFDYRYLNAFLSAAKTLSLTKAAKELGIAHSAVSRQVALLEESVGEDLFFRGARGLELTPRGQQLYLKLSETNNWLQSEFTGSELPLRIGGLEGVLTSWLGHRLATAKTSELPRNLIFRVMSNDEIEAALERKEIDIGLSSRQIESEWISSRRLFTEKIVIISAHAIDLEKIESYRWIGVEKASYLQRAFKRKTPVATFQAGSLELLLRMVASGKGIAAIPGALIRGHKFVMTELPLKGEAIYLNLPNYQRQPDHITGFIRRFLGEYGENHTPSGSGKVS